MTENKLAQIQKALEGINQHDWQKIRWVVDQHFKGLASAQRLMLDDTIQRCLYLEFEISEKLDKKQK